MKDTSVRFEKLVEQARREAIPTLDVSQRVMRRLRSERPTSGAEWPLYAAAAMAVTAASIVMMLANQQQVLFDDPLANWLRPLLLVVMQ